MAAPTVHPVGLDAVSPGDGDFALMRTAWSGMVHHYLSGMRTFDDVITAKPAKPGSKGLDFQFWGKAQMHNWDKGKSLIRDTDASAASFASEIDRTSKTIFLDRPAVGTEPIDDWESFMSDPDEQRNVAMALTDAAMQERHYRIMSTVLAAANIATDPFGNAVAHPSACTGLTTSPSASAIKAAISAARVALRNRGFTGGKLTAILMEEDYATLLDSEPNAISREFTSGMNGGLDIGKIYQYMGVEIRPTNALTLSPTMATHDGTSVINNPWGTGLGYTVTGGLAAFRGVIFHEGAAGMLTRGGITSTVLDRREEYGMIVPTVQFTAGLNTLRTDAAIPLKVA